MPPKLPDFGESVDKLVRTPDAKLFWQHPSVPSRAIPPPSAGRSRQRMGPVGPECALFGEGMRVVGLTGNDSSRRLTHDFSTLRRKMPTESRSFRSMMGVIPPGGFHGSEV